jgi:hypothetical protein
MGESHIFCCESRQTYITANAALPCSNAAARLRIRIARSIERTSGIAPFKFSAKGLSIGSSSPKLPVLSGR